MNAVPADLDSEPTWRNTPLEQQRVSSLLKLAGNGTTALDIGARDGYLSRRLAQSFESVTALDLTLPDITHPKITPVQGNVTALAFEDRTFDCVLCAEVLEHVPTDQLARACSELMRVTRSRLIIGVPFREDSRWGRTTCQHCGYRNPPWGHVNSFDAARLRQLFDTLSWGRSEFIGDGRRGTNVLSSLLMDWAGNPFGTYEQDEPCVKCDSPLRPPSQRTTAQRLATRLAVVLHTLQRPFAIRRPNWIHVRFERPAR
jgi:hypothetical protein